MGLLGDASKARRMKEPVDGVAQAPGESGGDDRIEGLERLAKLKESGALTEQEFEREKARILGNQV